MKFNVKPLTSNQLKTLNEVTKLQTKQLQDSITDFYNSAIQFTKESLIEQNEINHTNE